METKTYVWKTFYDVYAYTQNEIEFFKEINKIFL